MLIVVFELFSLELGGKVEDLQPAAAMAAVAMAVVTQQDNNQHTSLGPKEVVVQQHKQH